MRRLYGNCDTHAIEILLQHNKLWFQYVCVAAELKAHVGISSSLYASTSNEKNNALISIQISTYLRLYLYLYFYTAIYIHIYIYIYIYIYT